MRRRILEAALWLRRRTEARVVRRFAKREGANPGMTRGGHSAVKLDLYTPLIEKDLPVFRHSLRMARENIRHPLGTHFVVAPEREPIRAFCREHGCEFVDERSVLEVDQSVLKARFEPAGFDRSGWLFQQFLKLALDRVVQSEHCLVLDSDTIFVHPVVFETGGRYVLDYTDGYAEEYDPSLYRLLGDVAFQPYSFICHYMLFEKARLRALHHHIEQRLGDRWDRALEQAIDYRSFYGLSEYELYANFVLRIWPTDYLRGYWFNRSLELERFSSVMDDPEVFAGRLKTVSFHYYNRRGRELPPEAVPRKLAPALGASHPGNH